MAGSRAYYSAVLELASRIGGRAPDVGLPAGRATADFLFAASWAEVKTGFRIFPRMGVGEESRGEFHPDKLQRQLVRRAAHGAAEPVAVGMVSDDISEQGAVCRGPEPQGEIQKHGGRAIGCD